MWPALWLQPRLANFLELYPNSEVSLKKPMVQAFRNWLTEHAEGSERRLSTRLKSQ